MHERKSYTVEEATLLLERYCIYQDRCHKEVEEKLRKINMIPDAQTLITLHLLQHNFLNEERFAKSYVRGKFLIKKWGRNKITSQLKWKGISSYNIKTGLQEIDDDLYLTTLEKIATKKLPLIKGANHFIKRKKLSTFLIGKGYEYHLVADCVTTLFKSL